MDLKGKTAVITGAGSGIGRAIAEKCSQLGMNLILADINQNDLNSVSDTLKKKNTNLVAVHIDVSKNEDIKKLADKTYSEFGSCDLLCNNAGVGSHKPVWESTIEEWEWVMGVNLWSVIYGVKEFIPRMLKQDSVGYVVNTASLAGISSSNLGSYSVTKHAVVALSETLNQSLELMKSKLQVAVLCPGMVRTRIMESDRYDHSASKEMEASMSQTDVIIQKRMEKAMQLYGIPAEEAVEILFKELEEKKFYILTHKSEEQMMLIKERMNSILSGTFPKIL